jgi:hypothetical protein
MFQADVIAPLIEAVATVDTGIVLRLAPRTLSTFRKNVGTVVDFVTLMALLPEGELLHEPTRFALELEAVTVTHAK